MKEKNALYYKRAFLNPEMTQTSAHIIAEIEKSRNGKSVEATIQIADCTRKICLEFSLYNPNPDDIESVLFKLELLKTTISEFEIEYLKKIELIKKAQIIRKRTKGKKDKK